MAIPKGAKANFETLKKAFLRDDVALMECRDKKTGEMVDAVCAMNMEKNGDISFAPFAIMVRENPYDRFEPPPDRSREP